MSRLVRNRFLKFEYFKFRRVPIRIYSSQNLTGNYLHALFNIFFFYMNAIDADSAGRDRNVNSVLYYQGAFMEPVKDLSNVAVIQDGQDSCVKLVRALYLHFYHVFPTSTNIFTQIKRSPTHDINYKK